MEAKSGSVEVQKWLRCNVTRSETRSKRAIFNQKRGKSLNINDLNQNTLKCRILAFLRARKSLLANSRVLDAIVVKIYGSSDISSDSMN